ncbi:helix-turn-helix domain-containing protein [Streptomyces cyaneofuscatus]|uniref:helix-turn-helix domain-containing protein n=1 Tax=Streptomyces cyaneofuscatus TaxID=66883 RepID=UPI0033AA8B9C
MRRPTPTLACTSSVSASRCSGIPPSPNTHVHTPQRGEPGKLQVKRHNLLVLAHHCPRSRAVPGRHPRQDSIFARIGTCPRSWTPLERCALVRPAHDRGQGWEAFVTPDRLQLTDSDLLRQLMRWAPNGRPLTIRELADAAGASKSKIGALLSGERTTVTPDVAGRITTALGVHERALFFQPLPTPMGADKRKGHRDDHERTVDAHAARGSQELVDDDRPVRSDRGRS